MSGLLSRLIMATMLVLQAAACDQQASERDQTQGASVPAPAQQYPEGPTIPISVPVPQLPETPTIEADVAELTSHLVRFTITTNLPLPIEVIVDVSLADQAPEDTWVGHSERISLREPVTVFDLQISDSRQSLPTAEYDAEVSFYPRWGAEGNPAARGAPELHWSERIFLQGSGENRDATLLRNELRSWVIENVIVDTPWNEVRFSSRLGEFEKYPSTLNHHDAYYFPDADMTIIVNRIHNDVMIWRMGRASR